MSYEGKPVFAGYVSGAAVATSDTATLTPTKGLWIGGAGNVTVTMRDGTPVTFTAVPAGTELRVSVTQVKATGTTATNIVALW